MRERCEVGPDKEVAVDSLYAAYRTWCDDNGHIKMQRRPLAETSAPPSCSPQAAAKGPGRPRARLCRHRTVRPIMIVRPVPPVSVAGLVGHSGHSDRPL